MFRESLGGHQWVCLDVDGIEVPSSVSTNQQRLDYVVSLLPKPFQDVSYHFQWSSSPGLTKTAKGVYRIGWNDRISVHLWYFLSEPWTDTQLHDWVGGMDRQTLRDWAHRFNAEGPSGLIDRWAGGVKPRLSAAQKEELSRIVEAGPDPDENGVVRWRGFDLKTVIRARFGIDYHERTVGKLLNDLGFSHVSARPRQPKDQRYQNVYTSHT